MTPQAIRAPLLPVWAGFSSSGWGGKVRVRPARAERRHDQIGKISSVRAVGIEPPVLFAGRIEMGAGGDEIGRLAAGHPVDVQALGAGGETRARALHAHA